ncbi:MAG: nickel-dependent hydrogenase large subunit, partial [Acidiferrobacterales bacterium]|nr:nickel-dependent hydrogenase large subunit [Acidiferrobacterales bacterium]
MSQRVVVDPITRIEGHLRIEAQMSDDQIAEAFSSGTMVRGIEIILRGRDPRDAWAFAQRICGVCTLVHGIASVRAVEDALKYDIPSNAQLIRNLMIGAQFVHDHVMHFYHLHALDWVDVVSALKADPKATSALAQSISSYAKSSPAYFADMQKKLKNFVESGQLGIFANGYWGHPAYKLPPEANLMAVAHYLEALAWQRDVVQIHTIFGGKNPHPNFVVGGAPSAISVQTNQGKGNGPRYRGGGGATAIDLTGLEIVKNVIDKMRAFVDQVYVPDTLAIAGFYKDWGKQGEGVGNFLCYGDFPSEATNDPAHFLVPRGVILNRDLTTIHDMDLNADDQIEEYVAHSWYKYKDGKDKGLHPYKGETEFDFTGPNPPYDQLDVDKGYS